MTLRVYLDPSLHVPPVHYVLGWIGQHLGVEVRLESHDFPLDQPALVYANNLPAGLESNGKVVHIVPSGFFRSAHYLKRSSMPLAKEEYKGLPFLVFTGQGAYGEAAYPDFLAMAFFWLTCYEEFIETGARDHRQRRHFTSLTHHRFNLLSMPVLDYWIKRISTDLSVEKATWPSHGTYGMVISRDIDSLTARRDFSPRKFARAMAKGRPLAYLKQTTWWKAADDEHDNLEEIWAWEKKHGLISSNYFLASEKEGDANYSLDTVAKKEGLYVFLDSGWEAGFHPGSSAFQDPIQFSAERDHLLNSLGIQVVGGRQHGLRFANPHTWRLWEMSGMEYDSTVGYAEHEGFKAGTCFPYYLFDLLENRRLDLIELPITLMDCTLDKYRKLSLDEMERICLGLRSQVASVGGIFVLLWHNTYFGAGNIGEYHRILSELVLGAKSEGAWIATARDINRSWREHARVYGLPFSIS